jgi:hypothetical protein
MSAMAKNPTSAATTITKRPTNGSRTSRMPEEGEEVLINADTGVTMTKKRKQPTVGTRLPRWKALEDECLIDVLKVVSFCPITGANQTSDKYYKRLLDQFNERKNYGDYATIHMIRNEGALSHRSNIINVACSKFHGYFEKVKNGKRAAKR